MAIERNRRARSARDIPLDDRLPHRGGLSPSSSGDNTAVSDGRKMTAADIIGSLDGKAFDEDTVTAFFDRVELIDAELNWRNAMRDVDNIAPSENAVTALSRLHQAELNFAQLTRQQIDKSFNNAGYAYARRQFDFLFVKPLIQEIGLEGAHLQIQEIASKVVRKLWTPK